MSYEINGKVILVPLFLFGIISDFIENGSDEKEFVYLIEFIIKMSMMTVGSILIFQELTQNKRGDLYFRFGWSINKLVIVIKDYYLLIYLFLV